jgi:hypothetical protein
LQAEQELGPAVLDLELVVQELRQSQTLGKMAGVYIIHGSECRRDQPQFGLDSNSPEMGVYNIIEFKHYNFKTL